METLSLLVNDPFFRAAELVAVAAALWALYRKVEGYWELTCEDIYCLQEDKADCRAVERELDRMSGAVQALHDTAEKHQKMLKHMAKMRAAKAAKKAKASRPALKIAKTA